MPFVVISAGDSKAISQDVTYMYQQISPGYDLGVLDNMLKFSSVEIQTDFASTMRVVELIYKDVVTVCTVFKWQYFPVISLPSSRSETTFCDQRY